MNMATLSAKVFKHHKKTDGTFNVKVCIHHNNKRVYMDTEHYVTDKKLDKSLRIKDTTLNRILYVLLDEYRDGISRLGLKVDLMTADDIKAYLLKRNEKVDLLTFGQIHIDYLESQGRKKSASTYRTVRNSLIDFLKGTTLHAEEVSPGFLLNYERFLRRPRTLKRLNQKGKEVTTESKGLSDAGVHNYIRDFKGLFTAAQVYYNKPSLGIVPLPYNPFKEYKFTQLPETRKRNLTIEQMLKIKNLVLKPNSRAELSRDLFMLSFYLCGMNAVDLYNCGFNIIAGRLSYQRSKTKGKRKDHAFISLNVPECALVEINKYKNTLYTRYAEIGNLNAALNKGLKEVGKLIDEEDLTFYWARHTFGNLARNKCRKSKDDVALALNHVDHGRRTTDIYLDKDWSIVDEVQTAVLSLLEKKLCLQPANDSGMLLLRSITLPTLQ
jgi:integrase